MADRGWKDIEPDQTEGGRWKPYEPPTPPKRVGRGTPHEQGWLEWLASQGIRTIPAVGGAILGSGAGPAGTVAGGAGGAALGNVAGQAFDMWMDPEREFNLAELGVETAVNAIPVLGKAPGAGATAKELMKYAAKIPGRSALEGAALNAASTPFQHWAQTGDFDASMQEYLLNTGLGAGLGYSTGHVMGRRPMEARARGLEAIGGQPPPGAAGMPGGPPVNPFTNRFKNRIQSPSEGQQRANTRPVTDELGNVVRDERGNVVTEPFDFNFEGQGELFDPFEPPRRGPAYNEPPPPEPEILRGQPGLGFDEPPDVVYPPGKFERMPKFITINDTSPLGVGNQRRRGYVPYEILPDGRMKMIRKDLATETPSKPADAPEIDTSVIDKETGEDLSADPILDEEPPLEEPIGPETKLQGGDDLPESIEIKDPFDPKKGFYTSRGFKYAGRSPGGYELWTRGGKPLTLASTPPTRSDTPLARPEVAGPIPAGHVGVEEGKDLVIRAGVNPTQEARTELAKAGYVFKEMLADGRQVWQRFKKESDGSMSHTDILRGLIKVAQKYRRIWKGLPTPDDVERAVAQIKPGSEGSDHYLLPSGEVVSTDATATKGQPTTSFTTREGEVIEIPLIRAAVLDKYGEPVRNVTGLTPSEGAIGEGSRGRFLNFKTRATIDAAKADDIARRAAIENESYSLSPDIIDKYFSPETLRRAVAHENGEGYVSIKRNKDGTFTLTELGDDAVTQVLSPEETFRFIGSGFGDEASFTRIIQRTGSYNPPQLASTPGESLGDHPNWVDPDEFHAPGGELERLLRIVNSGADISPDPPAIPRSPESVLEQPGLPMPMEARNPVQADPFVESVPTEGGGDVSPLRQQSLFSKFFSEDQGAIDLEDYFGWPKKLGQNIKSGWQSGSDWQPDNAGGGSGHVPPGSGGNGGVPPGGGGGGDVPPQNFRERWGWGQGNEPRTPTPEELARKEAGEKEPPGILGEILSVPTNATTTGDLSAPGRQGLSQIFTPEFWSAGKAQIKALFSQEAYEKLTAEIKSKDMFRRAWNPATGKFEASLADKIGFKLMSTATEVGQREEATASRWLETGGIMGPETIFGMKNYARSAYNALPGRVVRATNRAYVLFLNHLRANRLEKLMNLSRDMAITGLDTGFARPGFFKKAVSQEEALNLNPYHNLNLAKEMVDFINTATGRGPLKTNWAPHRDAEISLEKSAGLLGKLLFSPRLLASRIRMLNPNTYIMASPQVRKQYLHAAFSTAAAWGMFSQLIKLGGGEDAEISYDPTSADFGKVRIGDTRLDPGGGFLQFITAISRLYEGGTTSSASQKYSRYGSGYQAETSKDAIERFFVNKLNPTTKFAYDIANATEYNPVHMGDRTMQMFVPLIAQDMYGLAQENPELLPLLGIPITVGMGTQTYGKGESISKFISPENDWLQTGGGLRELTGDVLPSLRGEQEGY